MKFRNENFELMYLIQDLRKDLGDLNTDIALFEANNDIEPMDKDEHTAKADEFANTALNLIDSHKSTIGKFISFNWLNESRI